MEPSMYTLHTRKWNPTGIPTRVPSVSDQNAVNVTVTAFPQGVDISAFERCRQIYYWELGLCVELAAVGIKSRAGWSRVDSS